MADGISYRVMSIFEAGSRLKCGAETLALAAYLYHRFFKLRPEMSQYELFNFAAGCIHLAHRFYEKPLDTGDLVTVMVSVAHGPKFYLRNEHRAKLVESVEYVAKIIALNLDFNIDFKDCRVMTPGQLLRMAKARNEAEVIELDDSDSEGNRNESINVDDDDVCNQLDLTVDKTLSKNSKHAIGAHRYLAHYLKSIQLLVDKMSLKPYRRLCNVAWFILSDFHWSPSVIQHYAQHIACACLMLAIEAMRIELDCRMIEMSQLWLVVNRRWNLIFCDDLDNEQLYRLLNIIVKQYEEYDRVLEHEFSTYVIDPKTGDKGFNKKGVAK